MVTPCTLPPPPSYCLTLHYTALYTLYIEKCTLDTGHCTLHTSHCTLHTTQCTLHIQHCTKLNTAHCAVHTAHCSVHTAHCAVHTAHCAVCTALCIHAHFILLSCIVMNRPHICALICAIACLPFLHVYSEYNLPSFQTTSPDNLIPLQANYPCLTTKI